MPPKAQNRGRDLLLPHMETFKLVQGAGSRTIDGWGLVDGRAKFRSLVPCPIPRPSCPESQATTVKSHSNIQTNKKSQKKSASKVEGRYDILSKPVIS